jgi:hypothetical protein
MEVPPMPVGDGSVYKPSNLQISRHQPRISKFFRFCQPSWYPLKHQLRDISPRSPTNRRRIYILHLAIKFLTEIDAMKETGNIAHYRLYGHGESLRLQCLLARSHKIKAVWLISLLLLAFIVQKLTVSFASIALNARSSKHQLKHRLGWEANGLIYI